MREQYRNPNWNPVPYVPASLGEIKDQLICMVGGAPTFIDDSGVFPDQNLESEFEALVGGLGRVRGKLGEERFALAVNLAARAKELFVDDPDESNGKTMEGVALLYEIEDVIRAVRSKRVAAEQVDDEGEVTGD